MEAHSSRRGPRLQQEIPPRNNRGADRVRGELEWSCDETRSRRDPDGAGAGIAFLRPSKLPALGASLGQAIRGFKRGLTSADPEPERPALEAPDRQSESDSP